MQSFSAPFIPSYSDWVHARRMLRGLEPVHYMYDFGLQVGITLGVLIASAKNSSSVSNVGGALIFLGLLWTFFPVLRRLGWRNSKWKNVALSFEFSQQSLSLTTETEMARSSTSVDWAAIRAFDEDEQIFFWLTKGSMLFLPKRDLTPQLRSDIKNLSTAKVSSHAD